MVVFLCSQSSSLADNFPTRLEKSNMVFMRDGVNLSTDLYFPDGVTEKLPVILVRTAYGKRNEVKNNPLYQKLIKRGYVIAVQDIRGRFESEGEYNIATNRREDGYDTLDWLVSRPWSSGKVGTAGCSYLGETQVVLAAANHPNHVTAIPRSAASGYYMPGRAWQAFSGGVFELAQTAGWFAGSGSKVFYGPPANVDKETWFKSKFAENFDPAPKINFEAYMELLPTLPVETILDRAPLPPTDYKKWVTSAPDGPYYRGLDLATQDDVFNVPALFMDSWYDYGPAETLEMLKTFSENAQSDVAKNNQFLIIGPSTHCNYEAATENTIVGERELGDARLAYEDIQLKWYDYWLKGDKNSITDMPKIQYYVMGKNEWKATEVWPPIGTTYQKWYLNSGGNANSRNGDGVLTQKLTSISAQNMKDVDKFIYDPANPVPSLGGHTCCTGSDKEAGGYDQSEIELRDDVLVYTSDALKEGVEVTGALEVVLYVSTSVKDTDFTAKLVDVYPDGRAYNVQEGALRMRYRKSLSQADFITPGDVYEIKLDLHATSNYFPKGHRIRLEVSSSNFPRLERNLNTGGDNYNETEWLTAHNNVYHSNVRPSHILLPVIKP